METKKRISSVSATDHPQGVTGLSYNSSNDKDICAILQMLASGIDDSKMRLNAVHLTPMNLLYKYR